MLLFRGLSVCLYACLFVTFVYSAEDIDTISFAYDNTMSLPDRVKINVTYQASLPTPTSPGLLHHH